MVPDEPALMAKTASQVTFDVTEDHELLSDTTSLLMGQPDHLAGIFENSLSRQLFHHYNVVVAPQMVWIDSARNPFRELIMPLALQSPALMMSLLSMAAADLWTRSKSLQGAQCGPYRMMNRYHQQVLNMLADHMKDENKQGEKLPEEQGKDHASPTLAAFLLSSLNLKLGDSTGWRLHVRAAWAMIEHWNSCPSTSPCSSDEVRALMLQEIYAFKIWESVTTFRPLDTLYRDASVVDNEGPFIQYVKTILMICDAERRQFENCNDSSGLISLSDLEYRLDEARSSNKSYAALQECHSAAARDAFEHVVELFHYAGLLYGCQVLPRNPHSDHVATTARRKLFQHLTEIAVVETVAQDLTWPVFIAGTECVGCPEKQSLVQARLLEIMQLSGSLERPRILSFLKHLWTLQCDEPGSGWIKLARTYARDGKPILIV